MFDRLCHFLDQEKQRLLHGELDKISESLDNRSGVLQRWADETPTETEIAQIRIRFERNQVLMDAAREGLRSAIQNYNEVKTLAANFASYSPIEGRVLTPVGQSNRLNRKS